jgi:hypothetical protein
MVIWFPMLQPDWYVYDLKAKIPKAANPLPNTIKGIANLFMSLSVRVPLRVPG